MLTHIWLLGAAVAAPAVDLSDVAPVPERYTGGVEGSVGGDPWWPSFGDPGLDDAVASALRANLDLATTEARVEQSRAGTRQLLAPILPSVSAEAGLSALPWDEVVPVVADDDPEALLAASLGLSAAWRVDLWGAGVLAYRSARGTLRATEANRDAFRVTLATLTAEAWYDVVATRQQVAILERQLEVSRDLLVLVDLRYTTGGATGLDVLQQRQQVAAREASLPGTRALRAQAERRLAVLLGRAPSDVPAGLPPDLPVLPPPPPTGTPQDLATNRPDVRAAVAALGAAADARKAEVRDALPTAVVQGTVAREASNVDDFDTWDDTWSAVGALSLPLFSGGAKLNAVAAARAGEAAARTALGAAALAAVSEVETALAVERERAEAAAASAVQLAAARSAFDFARDRYVSGLVTYTQVLNALDALQAAELTELSARRQVVSARIQLHDALGGRWASAGDLP